MLNNINDKIQFCLVLMDEYCAVILDKPWRNHMYDIMEENSNHISNFLDQETFTFQLILCVTTLRMDFETNSPIIL